MISKNKTRQVCCFSACNQHNPNFEMKARAPLKDEKVNWIHVLQKKNIACRMVQCVTGAFNFRNSSFSPYEIYTHFRVSRVSEPKCFLYSLKIVLYDSMFCYLRVKVLNMNVSTLYYHCIVPWCELFHIKIQAETITDLLEIKG